ncbi:CLUMA_CG021463, isoform A [Clunio marinus]|uniref:CLUMA_CG021463, isoform A n=1 Tax=Clunio marinus TaxID=568069 RepID=A0A1J1J7J0_9DIPT|nr:CLUMA_CG021463, isoform A [Clunio marinus]
MGILLRMLNFANCKKSNQIKPQNLLQISHQQPAALKRCFYCLGCIANVISCLKYVYNDSLNLIHIIETQPMINQQPVDNSATLLVQLKAAPFQDHYSGEKTNKQTACGMKSEKKI